MNLEKPNINRRLDAELKRMRLRQILSNWKTALFLFGIAAFFAALAYDSPASTTMVEATIVGVVQHQSDTPKPSRIVIEFDNGTRSTVSPSIRFLPVIGSRIIVKETTWELWGRVSHSFAGCPDNSPACRGDSN